MAALTASGQTWDPEGYARNARFVAELAMPVVELLAPRPGERILDLGCGDGFLTARLAAMGCDVVGVDASAAQVAAARRAGVRAETAAAEALDFREEFDAVFSNATLHWVRDADAAIASVFRALRPGGRFVAELGGEGCVARIRGALAGALGRRGLDFEELDPWYFPSAAEYGARLAAGGFEVATIAVFPRPTPLPGELLGWLETFARSFTAPLDAQDREPFLLEVQEALRPHLCDSDGRWTADYTRLRFRAVRPPA
jgi:trans-aconitate methyltransferase